MLFNTIIKTSFIVGLIIMLAGALLKIMHSSSADTLLTIGFIANMIFVVTAIFEVRTSNKIDTTEKTVWTLAFIFFNLLTGIIYISVGRRRIASNL